jgi:hypothetical protein
MAETSGTNEWSALLEDTQRALANLRADDLEELAARAKCMLTATLGGSWIRQRIPLPQPSHLLDLTRQHRLLGGLLHATGRNLAVLRRTQSDVPDRGRAPEGTTRWVR